MRRRLALVGFAYLVWVTGWFLAAWVSGGEVAKLAHLWLMLTGIPSALISVSLPNESLLAIAAAGLLGLVQWLGVAAFDWYMERRRQSRH